MTQWRQIIDVSQVCLGLLHSLHTAVDGSHQGLLGQTLTTANNREIETHRLNKKSKYTTCNIHTCTRIQHILYVGTKL